MDNKHFSGEHISFALRQAESGTSVAEIVRKLGIGSISFTKSISAAAENMPCAARSKATKMARECCICIPIF